MQKCVTLSTTEADYVAMEDVLKEVLFLRQVWYFMLPEVNNKSLFQYSRMLMERVTRLPIPFRNISM